VLTDPPGNPISRSRDGPFGRGLSIILPERVPVNSAVRVDEGNRLLLGEVVYCEAHENAFRIGVRVEQYLRHTQDLEALRRAIGGTGSRKQCGCYDESNTAWTQHKWT
jgi:hypothetical protein